MPQQGLKKPKIARNLKNRIESLDYAFRYSCAACIGIWKTELKVEFTSFPYFSFLYRSNLKNRIESQDRHHCTIIAAASRTANLKNRIERCDGYSPHCYSVNESEKQNWKLFISLGIFSITAPPNLKNRIESINAALCLPRSFILNLKNRIESSSGIIPPPHHTLLNLKNRIESWWWRLRGPKS